MTTSFVDEAKGGTDWRTVTIAAPSWFPPFFATNTLSLSPLSPLNRSNFFTLVSLKSSFEVLFRLYTRSCLSRRWSLYSSYLFGADRLLFGAANRLAGSYLVPPLAAPIWLVLLFAWLALSNYTLSGPAVATRLIKRTFSLLCYRLNAPPRCRSGCGGK